ncbi:MAG: helix-turn-helix transcriptional regulator [Oscillospiraceae bacterium]|nr:helix-turn-helix transcriptional regulator [Oscillospiraceae bacterium]
MTIKELREKYGLSQAKLAAAIGVSSAAIGAIETGRMKVSPKIADQVKAVFSEAVETGTMAVKSGKKGKTAGNMAAKKTAKKPVKPAAKKTEVFIQSPMGGEITPEEILAKVGQADKAYVRPDQNKIYWVRGDETGSVDIW